jgi:pantothenate kinase
MFDTFASDRSSSWSPVVLSFIAGLSSASILWYAVGKINHESALSEDKELLASFRQWWLRDIQSRIGEMPSLRRRTRWPWDRKNRSGSSHPSSPDNTNTTTASQNESTTTPSPVDEKSGLCIGSIFGLDVGGTLAKLVYFEQKSEPSDHESLGRRERNYRSSASARAIFLARRGTMAVGEDLDTATSAHVLRQRARTSSTIDETEQAAWSPPRIRRRSVDNLSQGIRPLHSDASNEDLESLNIVRNESLPDDLHAYAETVRPSHVRANGDASVDDGSGSVFRKKGENAHVAGDADSEIRKSRSMLDFSKSRDHAEALDRFYNFARRLDSYREGVKDHELSFYSRELGGEFHFIRFETRRMQNAMDLIRANNLHLNICEMGATGGGAHKFAEKWEQDLGIEMKKQDELDSLVAGMQFVLSTVVGECYTFRPHTTLSARSSSQESSSSSSTGSPDVNVGAPLDEEDDVENKPASEDRGKVDEWWWSRKVPRDAVSDSSTYPYLLVTIGTGVSILRVDGPRKHERISGSTIGGGTYWGLIRLLTDLEDFEDVMKLAERGDPSKVDMMVGDIYGENSDALEKIGLPSNLVSGMSPGCPCIPCPDQFPLYAAAPYRYL